MIKKKKWIPVLLCDAAAAVLLTGMTYRYGGTLSNEDFIRLHVVANSDSEQIVRDEGYDYSVRAEFCVSWIPEKTYGSVTFPAGNYEALKILIGNAAGQNWWCVLYPPLCLIDSSYNGSDSSGDIMNDVMMSARYRELTEAAESGRPAKMLHLRFKSLDALKSIS